MAFWLAIVLGLVVGGFSGLLGIGGGVLLVPALVYAAGFSQQQAVGTTLAVMVPPIGIFAATEYWRNGYVDIRAAIWIALGFALGSFATAGWVKHIPTEWLVRLFAVLLLFLGVRMIVFSDRRSAVMADSVGAWIIALTGWAVSMVFAFGLMRVLRKKSAAYRVRPRFSDSVTKIASGMPPENDFQI